MQWCGTGTDVEDRKRAEERTRNENVALREEIDRSSMSRKSLAPLRHYVRYWSRWRKSELTDSTVLILG